MQEEFSAKVTARFVDDDDIVRTGRAMIELDGVNMLHLPIPTGYDGDIEGLFNSAADKLSVAKRAEEAAIRSASAARADADRVAKVAESTSWEGDRLTVGGKTSPSLRGPKGNPGPKGDTGPKGDSGPAGPAGITVVASSAEAARLPIGTLYAIRAAGVPGGVPPNPSPNPGGGIPSAPEPLPTDITIVGVASGNSSGVSSIVPKISGAKPGDKIIIAINSQGKSGMSMTPPAGFTQPVNGYWVGTQQSWIIEGDYTTDLTVKSALPADVGWAAIAVRGASTVTAGAVADRTQGGTPTTVTAPAAPAVAGDLILGFAFERTTAQETAGQISISPGWEKIHVTEQDANPQTVVVAKGGPGDMLVTYPNPQASNGSGVQVVCRA
ncbi:collagen-like triple helix repeat-containing protein [Corynebacterium aurimucosum]|uniref:Uncharacterized protein n=1 Tax=Corynebacterium aurimucosum (strain ATCC 700975 / DSM 44827 / CIP 107346 / CN-1) TaxID=548476 RepID=C3PIB3_CORA7|nr:collagen-like protein [Corynebacterium aurimucosum]ACP33567.1 hypothetical protein cauri_1974 [Corynebacterium aurimucosum ATCC 700975]QQU92320.1 collagen-like protein [Corynebacterium aurimucosum]